MNIQKEAAVQAVEQVSEEDLALINQLSRRELTAEEVYTFAVRLCDNDIDRDWERFPLETLEELGELFVGVSGVFDHQWSAKGQTARIYRTQVVRDPEEVTEDGQPYCYLKGWAYMMRTEENAGLIAEIDGGIKREVSVGCAVDRAECSICGEDLNGADCAHQKGQSYDGQLCYGILLGATDAYEWSFVAVPAQKRAGVVKSARSRDGLDQEAALGRKYLAALRQEVARLGCLVQPGADKALMDQVSARLGAEELEGLRKVYQAQAEERFVCESQLGRDGYAPEREQADSAFLI
jgi:hypothetical protein